MYLPPVSPVVKARPASIVGPLIDYSDIPQMQGLPSQLPGFNPLLLQLHREISVPLLLSHRPWGSASVLTPPLHVGHPQASVLHPGERGQKQWLIRAHLLSQAGERDGYGSHKCDVQGVPVVAEPSRKLQQPEVRHAFSRGSWAQITGPSAVAGCADSRECVGNYLHLLTGPLVVAAAVVAVCARFSSSCKQCLVACEHTEKETLIVGPPLSLCTPQQWSLVSLVSPGFFLDSLSCDTLAPSGCLEAANPSPLPGV